MFTSIAEGNILSQENFRKIFGIDNFHSTRENFIMESIHKFIKNVKNNYIIKRGEEESVIFILFVFIISISSSIAFYSFFF